jgi:hypothetical protein
MIPMQLMKKAVPGGKMARVNGGSGNRGVVIGFDLREIVSSAKLLDSNYHYGEGEICSYSLAYVQ